MSFSDSCLKFFVSGANFTFALGGLALIIVGTLYKLNLDDYTNAIPHDYQELSLAPTLTIVVGSIIFVIAFMGCCGAIRESTCLLTMYAVILLIIFLLQVGVGVFAFLEIKDKDGFEQSVNYTLDNIFSKYETQKELPDLIQKEFKCCGLTGSNYWTNLNIPIPTTCYKDQEKRIYSDGCSKNFFDFLMDSMKIIGITVLSLSALEVVGCIFSLCLSSSIKNRERRFRY